MWNDKAIVMDWRGVPRVIYDEGGREVWRGGFGPFGEPLYERGIVSNYIPFRLYGMYKDMETSLYYNVRRYYDWRVGRYLQPDPVSDLNLYAYTNNSPYNAVDPLGMFETEMRNYPFAFLHIGKPRHEEITEDAIKELHYQKYYPILYNHGFRVDQWGGPNAGFCISTLCAECRTSFVIKNVNPNPPYDYVVYDTVAQGANRADCLYWDDSSYHCDNSNFDGCWRKWRMIDTPQD